MLLDGIYPPSYRLQVTSDSIKKETPKAKLRILVLDLASLESVRKAAAEVNEYKEPIHVCRSYLYVSPSLPDYHFSALQVLINSAAIMAGPYATTPDGFESQFGTNHLGHFLFTALIFPRVQAALSPEFSPRIILVSSYGHRFSDIRWNDLDFSKGGAYDAWEGYGQSKTGNILFANELARRGKAKGILSYSLHPGS